MQVKDRIENPLLNRVEFQFSIRHEKTATPSRAEMIHLASRAEPGSKPELTIIKNVKTRFGQPLTTGTALIYDDENSMKTTEMKYMLARHAADDGDSKSAAAEASSDDVSGGEE